MTRDHLKLKGIMTALGTFIAPIAGLTAFFIKPLAPIAPLLLYGGPFIIAGLFVYFKLKDNRIDWKKYKCPHCGEFFEVEPGAGTVTHLICKQQVNLNELSIVEAGDGAP